MELSDAKKSLNQLLEHCTGAFGFIRRAPLTFVRHKETTEAFLLFGMRRDPRRYYAVTASIALRFPDLDPFVQGSPTNGVHINVPLHLVDVDDSFREWHFSNAQQLEGIGEEVSKAIAFRVIPFLDSNTTLEAFCTRLGSTSPRDWYVLPPEQRTVLLAAAQCVLGEKAAAIATIDGALKNLVDALPKKRTALELLRAKLV